MRCNRRASAAIVAGCTDTDVVPKPPWRERKEKYIEHLHHASRDVLRVSRADKLHNARSILSDLRAQGDVVWSRFTSSRENVLWYYDALLAAYRVTGGGRMADELERVLREIHSIVDAPSQRGS